MQPEGRGGEGRGGEGRVVDRLAGEDRYETSAAIAGRSLEEGAAAEVTWLASGRSFPDGLTAGPAAAAAGGVLLLVDGLDLDRSSAARAWLEEVAGAVVRLRLVGGGEVISATTEAEILEVLGLEPPDDPGEEPDSPDGEEPQED